MGILAGIAISLVAEWLTEQYIRRINLPSIVSAFLGSTALPVLVKAVNGRWI
jgi:hypothetical protein